MSDIVERARSYEIGNLAPQSTWVGDMHELAAEIERLTEGRDTMGNLWAREKEARCKAEAEIKVLQEALETTAGWGQAEITRLHAEVPGRAAGEGESMSNLDETRQSLALAHVEIGALNAEIDRLRTEIELLHAELRVTKKLGLAALQDAMRQARTGEER